ncbi:MAG TPA: hypothetical protein VGA95_04800 [Thermodesulfobacteriota bacterium]
MEYEVYNIYFVLILKQVQHRYKEATLRSFDPSMKLRARDRPFGLTQGSRQARARLALCCHSLTP